MTDVRETQTRDRSVRIAIVLSWVAFLILPRPASGLVNGLPLGPIEAAALLALVWLVVVQPTATRLVGAWVAAVALVLSLAVAFSAPDHGGFRAQYFSSADASGAFERSTEFKGRDFTRVDRTLHFEPGRAEFPLAFFNDLGRFNFYQPHEPAREQLAFSTVWDGHWLVDTDGGPRQLYVDAPGAQAEVFLDGTRVLSVSPLDAAHTTTVTPSRGWHAVQIRFISPQGSPRRLSVGESTGPSRIPFGAPSIATNDEESWQATTLPMARGTAIALDLLVLSWLAGAVFIAVVRTLVGVWQDERIWQPTRPLVALLLLASGVEAWLFATPWASRLMTLVGGDDTLTYESYARQIQLDSFLLAHGGGEPFFYQVLYPYLLAGMHVIFGETMFGPMLIQRLLLSLVVGMVVAITIRIRGAQSWVMALVCGVGYAFGLLAPISAKLLNESFFVPLLITWAAAMMAVCTTPTLGRAIAVGTLGGVTALTRSTAVLAWVVALASGWVSWKGVPRRTVLLASMLACSCGVMSLIAIRNWVVVQRLILMPGELPVTLYGGNEPPPNVVIDEERHRPFYDRFGLHPFTRQVIEYAWTAPAPFLTNLRNKALFALGYFDLYAPGWGYSVGLLALSIGSAVGLVATVRLSAVPLPVALLPALIALTHYVAVVIVYPKGMRLILPFHALMVPYAAVAADALLRRLVRHG